MLLGTNKILLLKMTCCCCFSFNEMWRTVLTENELLYDYCIWKFVKLTSSVLFRVGLRQLISSYLHIASYLNQRYVPYPQAGALAWNNQFCADHTFGKQFARRSWKKSFSKTYSFRQLGVDSEANKKGSVRVKTDSIKNFQKFFSM